MNKNNLFLTLGVLIGACSYQAPSNASFSRARAWAFLKGVRPVRAMGTLAMAGTAAALEVNHEKTITDEWSEPISEIFFDLQGYGHRLLMVQPHEVGSNTLYLEDSEPYAYDDNGRPREATVPLKLSRRRELTVDPSHADREIGRFEWYNMKRGVLFRVHPDAECRVKKAPDFKMPKWMRGEDYDAPKMLMQCRLKPHEQSSPGAVPEKYVNPTYYYHLSQLSRTSRILGGEVSYRHDPQQNIEFLLSDEQD